MCIGQHLYKVTYFDDYHITLCIDWFYLINRLLTSFNRDDATYWCNSLRNKIMKTLKCRNAKLNRYILQFSKLCNVKKIRLYFVMHLIKICLVRENQHILIHHAMVYFFLQRDKFDNIFITVYWSYWCLFLTLIDWCLTPTLAVLYFMLN